MWWSKRIYREEWRLIAKARDGIEAERRMLKEHAEELDVREEAVEERERMLSYREAHPIVPKEITLVHRHVPKVSPASLIFTIRDTDGFPVVFHKGLYAGRMNELIYLSEVAQFIKNRLTGDANWDLSVEVKYTEDR